MYCAPTYFLSFSLCTLYQISSTLLLHSSSFPYFLLLNASLLLVLMPPSLPPAVSYISILSDVSPWCCSAIIQCKLFLPWQVWGAVQQEWRVSRALEVLFLHVDNVKRMYERDHQELEELRRWGDLCCYCHSMKLDWDNWPLESSMNVMQELEFEYHEQPVFYPEKYDRDSWSEVEHVIDLSNIHHLKERWHEYGLGNI